LSSCRSERFSATSDWRSDRHPFANDRKILNLGAKGHGDVRIGFNRGNQSRLQIAPMDHPIRSAMSPLRVVTERHAHDTPAARAGANHQPVGNNHGRFEPIGNAEVAKNARRIRRELNAGAYGLDLQRLFKDGYAAAALRKSKCSSEPTDPGAGNDNIVRGCHRASGPILTFASRCSRRLLQMLESKDH
jgi:hypothetical protein